jgi:hypothetical protein
MTPQGKALKEAYQWEAKSQWKGKPLEGDIALSITLYFGTSAFKKLSLDALAGIVYAGDSQIAERYLSGRMIRRAHELILARAALQL